jgi:rhomboid protease GluP
MAFGFPASYETEIEVTGSHIDIRDAILRSFELLSWPFNSDESVNFITARVHSSLASWGEEFTVSLAEEPVISLKSSCRGIQVLDWGKNKRNVEKFVEVFNTRLTWVSSFNDTPPVYLDEDGRTPIERLIDEPAASHEQSTSFVERERNASDS